MLFDSEADLLSEAVNTVMVEEQFVDPALGVSLTNVENNLVNVSGSSSDIEFHINANANAILSEVASDNDALDGANSVMVSGGELDIQSASIIQDIEGYSAAGSDYNIKDSAVNVADNTDVALDEAVSNITVTDESVNAATGVKLDMIERDAANIDNIDFRVIDSAENIASELMVTGASLDNADSVSAVGGIVSASEAEAIQGVANYDASLSGYTIVDSSDALVNGMGAIPAVFDSGVSEVLVTDVVDVTTGVELSSVNDSQTEVSFEVAGNSEMILSQTVGDINGLSGADTIYVTDGVSGPGDLGMVNDAYDGVRLGEVEESLKENDPDANIIFGVRDGATPIVNAMSGDPTAYDAAEMVIADGDYSVDIDEAALLQGIPNYNAESSSYQIYDSAEAILSDAGKNIVEDSGVSFVDVSGHVDVADAVELSDLNLALGDISSNLNAYIEFDVSGSANDILNAGIELSGASSVDVNDGPVNAIDGVELDSLNEKLSETSPYLNMYMGSGDDAYMGSGDAYMGSGDNHDMHHEEHVIDFDVRDSAREIADVLVTDGSSSNLDQANSVIADGGIIDMDEAAELQAVAGYLGYSSDYSIADSSAAIISDASTATDEGVSEILVSDTVGVSDGITLNDMQNQLYDSTANIDFDVEGSSSEVIQNAEYLVNASNIEVLTSEDGPSSYGLVDVSGAATLQQLEDDITYQNPDGDVLFSVSDSAPSIAHAIDDFSSSEGVATGYVTVAEAEAYLNNSDYKLAETLGTVVIKSPWQTYGNVAVYQNYTDENGNAHSDLISDAPGAWRGFENPQHTEYRIDNVTIVEGSTFTAVVNDYDARNGPYSNSDLNISEVTVTPEYLSFAKLSLTAAEEIFVDGGNVSVDDAQLIQENSRYQEDNSSYGLVDSASAILDATEAAMDNGVDSITVEDHVVDADVGVALGKLEDQKGVEIDFNVEDSAGAIALELANDANSLDNAESVEANGGVLSVAETAELIGLANYSGDSLYDIADSAGAILSASEEVLSGNEALLNVTAIDVSTAAEALALMTMPHEGYDFSYKLASDFSDTADLTFMQATSITEPNSYIDPTTAVSGANISIVDTVTEIRDAISEGTNFGVGDKLEHATVHATVATVDDAVEIFYEDSQNPISIVVDQYSLVEDSNGDIDSSIPLNDISILQAKAIYGAENSHKIESISISDTFENVNNEIEWLKANINNNIHIEIDTLSDAKDLIAQQDTTYAGLNFTYDLDPEEISLTGLDNNNVVDSLALIGAENGPDASEISIADEWASIETAPVLVLAAAQNVHASGVTIDDLSEIEQFGYVDEVTFNKSTLTDAEFFSDLTVDNARLVLSELVDQEQAFVNFTSNGTKDLTISDALENLLSYKAVTEAAGSYSITTVNNVAYESVSEIGELTVEQVSIYYGATNFVSPENAVPGPNYIIRDTAQNIADGANSTDVMVANGLFAATSVVADGGESVSVKDASDIQGVSDYDASGSAYTITDSASAILGDTGSVIDEGVSGVIVADATGASSVDAVDGAALSELESQLGENVEFRIEDSAGAIAAELSSDNTLLDGADDLVVDGGDTTVAGASDIQGVAEYDASGSAYTITDSASAILGDTGSVIDEGVSGVIVADATGASSVDAVDGAALSELESQLGENVEFRIEDSAGAIAAELSSDNTLLDGADDLVVDGGDTTVAGASDIQGVAEYDASGSAYTITDSASAILGDTGSVIDEGVSGVIVADATGASSVDAVDGAALSELESQLGENVEFRIEDSAGAIAAELSSDNTLLDGADDLVVDGGDTTVAGASDIQGVAEYDASGSAYTITDSASAILGDSGSVIDEGVSGVYVSGPNNDYFVDASEGYALDKTEELLSEFENGANVFFGVRGDASQIADIMSGDASAYDAAEMVIADGDSEIDIDSASVIQSIENYNDDESSYTITDSASAILGDTGSVIDEGVSGVIVADATGASSVDAVDGAALSELESQLGENVEFRIEDSAGAIAAELSSDNTLLDGADDLVVDGGDTTVAGASDIQGVAAYDASGSAYTITDSASAILGDSGSVIHEAVTEINVDGPVGAGVGVQLGSLEDASFETGYSADLNYNVMDDAGAIATELAGDAGALDNAEHVVVDGGDICSRRHLTYRVLLSMTLLVVHIQLRIVHLRYWVTQVRLFTRLLQRLMLTGQLEPGLVFS